MDRPAVPWQDKGQVVGVRHDGRLAPPSVEVAIVLRVPDGRFVHRRMRCRGSDLESALNFLFDSNPERLTYGGDPSAPRGVQDQYFETADRALEAAQTHDPPADPDGWVASSSFSMHFVEDLKDKMNPEAAQIGAVGTVVTVAAYVLLLPPMLYVAWYLPDWLGIQNDDVAYVVFGIALFFVPMPANIVRDFIVGALMRHNLARETKRLGGPEHSSYPD